MPIGLSTSATYFFPSRPELTKGAAGPSSPSSAQRQPPREEDYGGAQAPPAPLPERYGDRNTRQSDYEPDGPPFDRDYTPRGDQRVEALCKVERWSEIGFDLNTEWLIKGVFPKQGVGLIYGKSQSFKSFVTMHIALSVALGLPWAGKRVKKAPVVYIAAEGAHGLRKRKEGYVKSRSDFPVEVDFNLISAAPNLGTEKGDLERRFAPRSKARASIRG